jgi:hypothetical protein
MKMKRRMETESGVFPCGLHGTSRVQGLITGPLSTGTGRLPYQAPLIEVTEVELESDIANGSAKLKYSDTTQWKVNDYEDQSVNAGDIELL